MEQDIKNTKYSLIYRQGYFKALLDTYNLMQTVNGKFNQNDLLLMLKAMLDKPDTLMEYGDGCIIRCIYDDKPKKDNKPKKPIAYEIMPFGTSMAELMERNR